MKSKLKVRLKTVDSKEKIKSVASYNALQGNHAECFVSRCLVVKHFRTRRSDIGTWADVKVNNVDILPSPKVLNEGYREVLSSPKGSDYGILPPC